MDPIVYMPLLGLVTFMFIGATRACTRQVLDWPVLDTTSARLLILAAAFLGAAWGLVLGAVLAP